MNQSGLIPIIFLISVLVIASVGVAGTLYLNKTIPDITFSGKDNQEFTFSPNPSTASGKSSTPADTQHLSAFQIILNRFKNNLIPSSSPISTVVPKPITPSQTTTSPKPVTTSTQTANPTPTPTPTSTPVPVKKNTCDINVIYGKLGGAASDPLLVTLVYSFSGYNNVYMTGAQWDFDGNGSWDTDLKQSNGTIEHTYSQSGTYNVKLQLQGSDGSITDVCTKSVTVSSPTPAPSPIAAQSCSGVSIEGATFVSSSIYSINSGATAKLTAQVTPTGVYVNWKIATFSSNLPNGGSFSYPDSNNTSIVNWTAPNNPKTTEEGVDIRGDISEYPNPWRYCPTITFAVKPM